MSVEDLSFMNARGERLAASVHRPDRATDLGAIVCHGMLSSRASAKHIGLCRELARRGVLAIRFDFAGRGESEGDSAQITYERQVEDLEAAVARLRREASIVALVGSSMGGAAALLYAARDRDVRCVVGIAAVGKPSVVLSGIIGDQTTFERWRRDGVIILEGQRIGWCLAQSSARTDVLAAARALHRPVLLLHGERDDVVPIDQAEALAEAAETSRLEVIIGGDHLLHRAEDQRTIERVVGEFVKLHLA